METSGLWRAAAVAVVAFGCASAQAQQAKPQAAPKRPNMSFFITSTNPGKGADLGGLAGADKYCQTLASAVGAGHRTWRAYLSAAPEKGKPAVNARERIGKGPWRNTKGVVIARNLEALHSDNNINKQTALNEKGETVNAVGERPLMHDILTGSEAMGTAIPGTQDTTCGNWTKSGEGSAMLGHHDRTGLREDIAAKSWNSSHPSIGCSMDALRKTGGGGLFYCFAAR